MDINNKFKVVLYDENRDFENIIESCKKENWIAFYTDRKECFREALNASCTYTAYKDGEYCGFIRFISDGFFTVYCCEIIVDKPFRGQGVGKLLMAKISGLFPGCSVDVISDNDDFYKANGFIILANGMRKRSRL